MGFEFTYDPTKPGGATHPTRRRPGDPETMNADTVERLMQLKQRTIADYTEQLMAAYVEHENVLRAVDLSIKFLERVADTPDLEKELAALRAHRETLDRLLFTGGVELRRDSMTMHLKEEPCSDSP